MSYECGCDCHNDCDLECDPDVCHPKEKTMTREEYKQNLEKCSKEHLVNMLVDAWEDLGQMHKHLQEA